MRLTLDQMLTIQKNALKELQTLSTARQSGTTFLKQDANRRVLEEVNLSISAARANSRPSIMPSRCGHYD